MIQMRNIERSYVVVATGVESDRTSRRTQKTITAICPFCQERVLIFIWSLGGSGKLCQCGAKFQSGGKAYKMLEIESAEKP